MTDITIRKVTPDDLVELQAVSKKTFLETFAHQNTDENIKKYLDNNLSLEQLRREVNNSSSEFYFALVNNEVSGYLKINSGQAQTEKKDPEALEIERIYVVMEFHGKKVGQVLYETALGRAKDKKVKYLWLGVWEENPRAISFYKKNGFIEFDRHIFKLGDDEQTDIMMRLNIEP